MVFTEINRIVSATISIGGSELNISLAVKLIFRGFLSFLAFGAFLPVSSTASLLRFFSLRTLGSLTFFSLVFPDLVNLNFLSFLELSVVSSILSEVVITSSSKSI